MQISLQVFLKDLGDTFGITYPKNGFPWKCFSKILMIDFRIATNLKTRLSKKWALMILIIYFKTTINNLFKGTLRKILKSFSSIISCLLSSGN